MRKSGLLKDFEEIDKNKDGKVSKDELKKVLEANGLPWDDLNEARFQLMEQNGQISIKGKIRN